MTNAGESVPGTSEDIDGEVRDEQPDSGADELVTGRRRGAAQAGGEDPKSVAQWVIYEADFDVGAMVDRCPGEFALLEGKLPPDSRGCVASAVPQAGGPRKWIRLQIAPPRPEGAHTRLRFRYHLTGASEMTVQIFDLTDRDNRHIRLKGLPQGEWQSLDLDFTGDAKRNDGTEAPFAAGHVVDDLFFFVQPQRDAGVSLLVDEVLLYDAGESE